MTTVLALDLGTRMGWALIDADDAVHSGTISFAPRRREREGMRFLRFINWLSEIRSAHGEIQELYYESVHRHLGLRAAHVYGGFQAVLLMWCEHHNIFYAGVAPQKIKKSATGRGNAKKSDVISAMRALGYEPQDDNEADALALLQMFISGAAM